MGNGPLLNIHTRLGMRIKGLKQKSGYFQREMNVLLHMPACRRETIGKLHVSNTLRLDLVRIRTGQ